MYGCFDGALIYGVVDDEAEVPIDYDFLDRFNMNRYATSVVRNYACGFAYGIGITIEQVQPKKIYRK
jgi:hypothetical protein